MAATTGWTWKNRDSKALAFAIILLGITTACSSLGDAPSPRNIAGVALDNSGVAEQSGPQLVVAPETGKEGPAGPRGLRGTQGPRGLQGFTGLQGPPGPAGLNAGATALEYDFAIYEPAFTSLSETPTTIAQIAASPKERILFLNFEAEFYLFDASTTNTSARLDLSCFLRVEGVNAYTARAQVQRTVNQTGPGSSRIPYQFTMQGALPAGREGEVDCTGGLQGNQPPSVQVGIDVWLRSAMAIVANTPTSGLLVVDAQYPWLEEQRLCDEGDIDECWNLRSWTEDGSPLRAYADERIAALTP